MKKLLFLLVVVLVFSAVSFGQDEVNLDELEAVTSEYSGPDGTWAPVAGSKTAMRNVVSEEQMYRIYTERRVLTEPLAIAKGSMKFYDYRNRKVGRTSNTTKCAEWRGKTCIRKVQIVIKVGVVIRINPNNRTQAIVEGCLNEFIIPFPFPELEKEVEPEAEVCINNPNLTVEEALELQEEGKLIVVKTSKGFKCIQPTVKKTVKTVEKTEPEPEDCVDCSQFKITGAKFKSKGMGAYLPSVKEISVAVLDGGLTSVVTSNDSRVKAGLLGAGLSAAKTVAYNIAMPDKNVLVLDVNGVSYTVRKKKGPVSVNKKDATLTLEWTKDGEIYGKLDDGTICFTAYVQNAFTVGTVTIVYRDGKKMTIPVKTITPTTSGGGQTQPNPTGGFPGFTNSYDSTSYQQNNNNPGQKTTGESVTIDPITKGKVIRRKM